LRCLALVAAARRHLSKARKKGGTCEAYFFFLVARLRGARRGARADGAETIPGNASFAAVWTFSSVEPLGKSVSNIAF
jgi:hypothetical protein